MTDATPDQTYPPRDRLLSEAAILEEVNAISWYVGDEERVAELIAAIRALPSASAPRLTELDNVTLRRLRARVKGEFADFTAMDERRLIAIIDRLSRPAREEP